MAAMESRLSQLEAENGSMRSLLQSLMAENATLKEQLAASPSRGAAAALDALDTQGSGPEPAPHMCLATVHLAAASLVCLRASAELVVMSLLPVLLQQLGARRGVRAAPSSAGRRCGEAAVGGRRAAVAASRAVGCAAGAGAGGGSVRARAGPVAACAEWWRVRLRPDVAVAA
jgi:hypothetical protein